MRESGKTLCFWKKKGKLFLIGAVAAGIGIGFTGCGQRKREDATEGFTKQESVEADQREVKEQQRDMNQQGEEKPQREMNQQTEGFESSEAILEGKEDQLLLPERFDYREMGRMPKAGDQGNLGTCWAFSSLMAMETVLLPDEVWDFSEDHMSLKNSFFLGQEEGGQYAMSMAYLLAWQGPVTEEEDPYGDGHSPDGLAPSKHVQEVRILEPKNYDRIKRAVYQTGGVQSSLFTRLQNSSDTDRYYKKETVSYYYPGSQRANHNVVIIGWDDHYPKERFNNEPEGDGAFICLNSWGPDFGEEGCFYVSYYDTNIGDVNVLYSGITDPDYYTGIYQSDLCGWIGQVGYGREEAYFANRYQARGREMLKAVGFYATMPGTSYEVYGKTGSVSGEGITLEKVLASGTFQEHGAATA